MKIFHSLTQQQSGALHPIHYMEQEKVRRIADYTLWEAISRPEAEIITPCPVFDRRWLAEKIGVGSVLELRFAGKYALRCVTHALMSSAVFHDSYSLLLYIDTSSSFSAQLLSSMLSDLYHMTSDAIQEALKRILVFPAHYTEHVLMHLWSIRALLAERGRPALLIIDNIRSGLTDRDWARLSARSNSLKSVLCDKLQQALQDLKLSHNATILLGLKEPDTRTVAEVSTPYGAVKLWDTALRDEGELQVADKRWCVLEGVAAPASPDQLLFPIVTPGVNIAIIKPPFETVLCETVDIPTTR